MVNLVELNRLNKECRDVSFAGRIMKPDQLKKVLEAVYVDCGGDLEVMTDYIQKNISSANRSQMAGDDPEQKAERFVDTVENKVSDKKDFLGSYLRKGDKVIFIKSEEFRVGYVEELLNKEVYLKFGVELFFCNYNQIIKI